MPRIRVLVIDDLPLARQVIAGALGREPGIEVVGVASGAHAARRLLREREVDVVTLDLEMPGIDGLSFLRALLAARPMPVVMVSALTPRGSAAALRALEAGAVEVVAKPDRSLVEVGEAFAAELTEKVKAAARARVRPRAIEARAPLPAVEPPGAAVEPPGVSGGPVILLGASTGGCTAIPLILSGLPADSPPVVCVQHIPAVFSAAFAARMNDLGPLRVAEARTGDALERGKAYVAPGGRHLVLTGRRQMVLEVRDGPPVNHHRPSIDVTFRSAAERLGPRAVAALLTGMGQDGARGLGEIRAAGGFTLAQDEETSVIFGMPAAAIRQGAAAVVAPLEEISRLLLVACQQVGGA